MVLIRVAALVPFLAVTHARSGSIRGASPIDLAEETAPVFNYAKYGSIRGSTKIDLAEEAAPKFNYAKYGSSQVDLAEEITTRDSLYNELLGLGEFEEDEIEFAEEDGNYGSFDYLLNAGHEDNGILLAEETTTRESLYDELGLGEFAEDEIEFAEEDGNYGSFDYLLNTGHEDTGILLAEETTTRESLYDELGLGEFAEDEIEFAEEDGNYGSFDYLLNAGHEDNGILLAEETTSRESLYDELGLGEFAEDEIEFAEEDGNYGSFDYLLNPEPEEIEPKEVDLVEDAEEDKKPIFNYAKYRNTL